MNKFNWEYFKTDIINNFETDNSSEFSVSLPSSKRYLSDREFIYDNKLRRQIEIKDFLESIKKLS